LFKIEKFTKFKKQVYKLIIYFFELVDKIIQILNLSEIIISIVGLDDAGKTTTAKILKGGMNFYNQIKSNFYCIKIKSCVHQR
jgi:hypothetical protein